MLRVFVQCQGQQFLSLAKPTDSVSDLEVRIAEQMEHQYGQHISISRLSYEGYDLYPRFPLASLIPDQAHILAAADNTEKLSRKRPRTLSPTKPTVALPDEAQKIEDIEAPAPPLKRPNNNIVPRSNTIGKKKKELEDVSETSSGEDAFAEQELSAKQLAVLERRTCKICGRQLSAPRALRTHMAKLHPHEQLSSSSG